MPLIKDPALQYADEDGTPWRFAKAYFTETETTTPVAVYQDETFSTPHTDPVVADARGIFPPVHFDPDLGLIRCRIIKEDGDLDNPEIDADPVNEVTSSFSPFADLVLTYTGNPDGTDDPMWLGGMVFDRELIIPHTFAGSRGKIPKHLPAGDYVITIKFNGDTIGTVTCNHTTGVWTYAGSSPDDIEAGDTDELDFYGASGTTIADFGLTIKCTVP